MSRNIFLVMIAFLFCGCSFLTRHPETLVEIEQITEEFIEDELGMPPRVPKQAPALQAPADLARPIQR